MKKLIINIFIFIIGIVLGVSINVYANKQPEPTSLNNVQNINSIHQEQVYINGTRYTVITSSAPSMVIMR